MRQATFSCFFWGKEDTMELPTIQQLRNFIIYSKYRNFTAAANAANITQSAFSAQIKKLEDIVGVELIERSNKGSHLTPDGEIFYEKISHILSDLEESILDLQGRHGQVQSLAVGIMLSLGDVHMNRHIAYFQKHHTEASFRVYNLEFRELLQWLKEDKLDIVSLFYLPTVDLSDYEKVFFGEETFIYYGPNMELPGDTVTAQFAASRPLAQYSPQYVMNAYINEYFMKNNCPSAKTQAWFSTPYAMMNYCQQNHIGALLPQRFLAAMGVTSGYATLRPAMKIPCCLVYKKENPKYKTLQIFIEYMRNVYHLKK